MPSLLFTLLTHQGHYSLIREEFPTLVSQFHSSGHGEAISVRVIRWLRCLLEHGFGLIKNIMELLQQFVD